MLSYECDIWKLPQVLYGEQGISPLTSLSWSFIISKKEEDYIWSGNIMSIKMSFFVYHFSLKPYGKRINVAPNIPIVAMPSNMLWINCYIWPRRQVLDSKKKFTSLLRGGFQFFSFLKTLSYLRHQSIDSVVGGHFNLFYF